VSQVERLRDAIATLETVPGSFAPFGIILIVPRGTRILSGREHFISV